MKPRYFKSCVNWPKDDVHCPGGFGDMLLQSRTITRNSFMRAVHEGDRHALERSLGYAPHCHDAILTMKKDPCVTYHKSKLHGETVYYIRHSAIEYVFK